MAGNCPEMLKIQAFFDKDYISSHPEDTERITHLKDLMQEQVRLSFELHMWN